MLKILQVFSKWGFNSMWTKNFQMFKLGLKKAEEPEIKLPRFAGHGESKEILEKYLLLLHWFRLWGPQQTVENS